MSTERVDIIVASDSLQTALNLAQQLDKSLNSLRTKKQFGTISGLSQSKTELQGYINELERLKKLQQTKIDAGLSTKSTDAAIKKVSANIREMSAGFDTANTKVRSLGDSMRTTFNRISSTTMHAGQQMQVLGKTLTQISSPMRTLFRSTVWAAGFKALNLVTSGFSGAFERYDTMNNYAKSLEALGLNASQTFVVGTGKAQTAIENLNDAVLGLPTGLDEIVAAQKIYAGATGEMVKSTKTAIAANNTFLASGTDSREQRFVQRYLASLASGAELTTTQWQSMSRIAPLAMRAVAEELGYAGEKYQDFIADVSSGTIAGQDFLDTFIKVGTEGKVQAAANVMKSTWEGLSANIQNATKRMGEGLLKALDTAFEAYNGRNLVQNLLGFDAEGNEVGGGLKHWINDISEAAQNWVKANPEKIIDFFNTLKGIDLKGFLKGAGEGLGKTLEFYKGFIEMFSGKGMEKFGYFMARAGFWGKGLNLLGGALKGLRAPIAAIGTVLAHIPAISGKLAGGTGIFGFLGKLIGKKKDMAEVANAGTVAKKAINSLIGVAKVAAIAGVATGTGFVVFKGFKSMFADIKAMTDMAGDIDWNVAKKIMAGMAGFIASFSMFAAGAAILPEASAIVVFGELILGAITGLATGIAKLVSGNLKDTFANFDSLITSLTNSVESIKKLEGFEVNKKAIQGAVESLSTVYDALKPQYQGTGIQNMSKRQASNMRDVVDSMVETIRGLADLKDVAKDLSGFEVFSEELSGNVQKAFESLGSMFDGFTESFGLGARTTTRNAGEIIGNIKEVFDSLVGDNGVMAQLKEIAPKMKELTDMSNGVSPLRQARQGIDDLFRAVGDIFDEYASKVGMYTEGNSAKAKTVFENTQGIFSLLTGENGVISQMGKLSEALPQLVGSAAAKGRGRTPIDNVKQMLGDMFTAIGDIYESITSEDGLGLYKKVNDRSSETVKEVFDNIKSMFDSLIGEDGIVAKLTSLTESLPQLVGSPEAAGRGATPMDNVRMMLENMFQSLSDIYDFINEDTSFGDADMGAFAESIGQLPAIMDSIQQAVTTLSTMQESMTGMVGEGGSFPIVEQIKGVISQLSQVFSAETIAVLQAQVEGFKSTVTSLIDSITSMTGMSEGAPVELAITFTHTISGADDAVSAIKAADNAIRSAVAAIQTSYTKTITVTLKPTVNRLPMPSTSYYPHTGGYIGTHGLQYRASGGSIFRKRGSDVVHAMLTPGEYVENKRAVNFFGIDFMRKVNNLDLHGALNSLLQKAGNMATASTTINNYNNQKVVINNNGNAGAGFTFKAASRFAGAL